MIEKKSRRLYWRETKLLSLRTLWIPALVVLSLPFWTAGLNVIGLAGFTLGYVLLAHVALIVTAVATARFVARQDEIDHWHGAHEDL